MAGFGVEVIGGNRLRSTMRKAGMDVKELTAINKEAAAIVTGAAKALAPIGKPGSKRGRGRPKSGGALAASIRAGATTRAGVVRAGGARVPYANVQHWGWPRRGIRAKHFVSDAAISTEHIWVKNYERKMNAVIKKVKGA